MNKYNKTKYWLDLKDIFIKTKTMEKCTDCVLVGEAVMFSE